jgi:hypothetical protein
MSDEHPYRAIEVPDEGARKQIEQLDAMKLAALAMVDQIDELQRRLARNTPKYALGHRPTYIETQYIRVRARALDLVSVCNPLFHILVDGVPRKGD